jgi:anti-sigma factor RsiW
MSHETPPVRKECAEAREAMQELMDGPVPAVRRATLDEHLADCAECREVRQGLETVRTALRALPEIPLPGDALDQVWARTVDAGPDDSRVAAWKPRLGAIAAVAASLLVVALAVKWSSRLPPEPATGPALAVLSDEEIEQAREEAKRVLEITAVALARSERAAFERVLGEEVSPAIRRIGIQWPEKPSPDDRRSKT